MKLAARLAAALVLSVALAWGLSWLTDNRTKDASPVFQPDKARALSEMNMVDALAALPLELDIAKASYGKSVMTVDLFWPTGLSGERLVYHDLYELSHFAWSSTTNVERVVIRVMLSDATDRRNRELLVAMEAKRTQEDGAIDARPGASAAELRTYLESRYHFSYTPKWKQKF
ncbi:MAG: hypothetical protein K0R57_3295 [Paenibacillaceae bacterium]|jgi:hypothetical protein|nr:hypothetical protein [Paenibacillaceae bacterium]